MTTVRRARVIALAALGLVVGRNLFADEKPPKASGGPARWEATIRGFEAADAAKPPPRGAVLLVGGSNARRWTDVGDYFPGQVIINRGFGGARLSDVLHFAGRIVLPYAPKTIVLNAGGNDLSAGQAPAEIQRSARALIAKVRATLPQTRIYVISVPPVLRAARSAEAMQMIRRLNVLFAELARAERNVDFVDLFPVFLGADGQPRAELYVADGTHFSPKGYAALASLLRDKL